MRYSIHYYVVPVVTCPTPQFAVAEIVEIPSYIDDDAFSSPPFASGFGREEEDGPSAPPPFDTDELPPPPPSFKSKLPTSGFRDPHPPSPKIRRPRRPYPTVGGAGGGSGHVAGGGGGNGGDLVTCFPPTCIPPSTATAVAALPPLPSSSHHPLPPLHDEHNRDAYSGPRLDGPFLRFLDSNNSSFNRT